jgi:hypothetical protein
MKFIRYFIFFVLIGTIYTSHGFCKENQKLDGRLDTNKTYVQPNQIFIEPNGIFINLLNEWFETNSLCSDEAGIYVTSDVHGNPNACWGPRVTWECPKCHYVNGPFTNKCKKCGH